jgi:peroxiredoxin
MPYRVVGVAVLIAGLALASGDDPTEKEGAQAYRALVKKYDEALAACQKAFDAAKTRAEKEKALVDKHPRAGEYAQLFLALARKHRGTPAAADSLAWIVSHPLSPNHPQAGLRPEALTILARDHADSDQVGQLCLLLVFSIDAATETFLRGVLARSKNSTVKGQACAALGANLKHRVRLLSAFKEDPAAVKLYEQTFGKKAVAHLQKSDPARLRAESEKLLDRVKDKFADVPHPSHGTLGKYAHRHLLAMRAPVDADRLAPTIIGEDVAGKKLRLSDFKGSVVLLDFWDDAVPRCRAHYAYERDLVKRLAGKPFALLGVNSSRDRAAVRKVLADQKITWRSFWDHGDPNGPIATRWDVDVRPTLFLIDHKGVIRHYFADWPATKQLDAVIDTLIQDARKNP